MTRAKNLLIQKMAEDKKPVVNFKEIGSRAEDLDVGSDGSLESDDEISFETYRKMRKDPQVKACLLVLKLPLIQTDWQVSADNEDAQVVARWVEAQLSNMDDSMQYYLREMLTALDFGHSVTEKVWKLSTVRKDPDEMNSPLEQMIVPFKLKTYDPRNLTFKLDPKTYKLEGVIQKTDNGDKLIPAEKLLIFSHEKEFGNYNGESALRAAYKPWIIKEFLQKFWNIALERYGSPFMSMSMPQGAQIKDALKLMNIAKGKAGIPLPDGYEVEIHNLANAGMSFKEAIEYQDRMIARAMLIPDLVFSNSDSGAYALSKTHASFFIMRLNAIAQEIGDIFTKYLIKPLTQYNYGELLEYPELTFSDVADEDKKLLLDIVDKLVNGKVVAPSENWIRERLGLPQVDEGDAEYLESQWNAAKSGLDNLNNNNPGEKDPEKKDPKTKDPEMDKKAQDKINKNNEQVEEYYTNLRSSVRGLLLGIGQE